MPKGFSKSNPGPQQQTFPILSKVADGILLASAAAWIGVFLSFVSKHEHYFTDLTRIALFYALPLLIVLFFFAALRFSQRLKISLAWGVVLVVSVAYLVELTLTYSHHIAMLDEDPTASHSAPSKAELIEKARSKGRELYPTVYPEALLSGEHRRSGPPIVTDGAELLPLAGISRKPTVLCNETGEFVLYRSDEHGFNNPAGIWPLPQIQIAALGDSFTHGWCVPEPANFVARIREAYPATLNLGMMGNGPLAMLATLREYLSEVQPQVVLWCYFENDLLNLMTEKNNDVLRSYLDEDFLQRLPDRQEEINKELEDFVGRIRPTGAQQPRAFRLRNFLGLMHVRNLVGFAGWRDIPEDNWGLFREILLEANQTVKSWDGKLYFVYLPSSKHYFHTIRLFNPGQDNYETVKQLVQELDLPFIDIYQTFRQHPDPTTLFPAPEKHYNAKGHQLTGRTIVEFLQQKDAFQEATCRASVD